MPPVPSQEELAGRVIKGGAGKPLTPMTDIQRAPGTLIKGGAGTPLTPRIVQPEGRIIKGGAGTPLKDKPQPSVPSPTPRTYQRADQYELHSAPWTEETWNGFVKGLYGLAETAGLGMQFAAYRFPGMAVESEIEYGKKIERWAAEKKAGYEPKWKGETVFDRPELLKDASWWAHNVAEQIPMIAACLIPSAAGGKVIQIGGRAFRLSPMLTQRLAHIGQWVIAGTGAGGMEAMQTYKAVRDETGDEKKAAKAGALMGAVCAVLNSLSFERILRKLPTGVKAKLMRFLATGTIEAVTEMAEEPSEALAISISTGKELGEELRKSVRGMVEVGPIAFALGAAMGPLGGVAVPSDVPITKDTNPETGESMDIIEPTEPLLLPGPKERKATEGPGGRKLLPGPPEAPAGGERRWVGKTAEEGPAVYEKVGESESGMPIYRRRYEAPPEKAPPGVGEKIPEEELISERELIREREFAEEEEGYLTPEAREIVEQLEAAPPEGGRFAEIPELRGYQMAVKTDENLYVDRKAKLHSDIIENIPEKELEMAESGYVAPTGEFLNTTELAKNIQEQRAEKITPEEEEFKARSEAAEVAAGAELTPERTELLRKYPEIAEEHEIALPEEKPEVDYKVYTSAGDVFVSKEPMAVGDRVSGKTYVERVEEVPAGTTVATVGLGTVEKRPDPKEIKGGKLWDKELELPIEKAETQPVERLEQEAAYKKSVQELGNFSHEEQDNQLAMDFEEQSDEVKKSVADMETSDVTLGFLGTDRFKKFNDLTIPQITEETVRQFRQTIQWLGFKDYDEYTTEISHKDAVDAIVYGQYPYDITLSFPNSRPVYDLQQARHIQKNGLDNVLSDMARPYFSQKTKVCRKIDDINTIGEAEEVDGRFDTETLEERFGADKNVIAGYNAFRDVVEFMHEFLAQDMIAHGVAEEKVAEFRGKIKHYVPHVWPGKYRVVVYDAKGKIATISGCNWRNRFEIRNQLQKAYDPKEGYRFKILKATKLPPEAYEQMAPYAVSNMVDQALKRVDDNMMNEDQKTAMRHALRDVVKEKGFGAFYLKRKGTPGWTKDLAYPLANYMAGFSGFITKMRFIKGLPDAMSYIDANKQPRLWAYWADTVNYWTSNKSEYAAAKTWMYYNYLWINVKSASLQLTQNLILGWPELSKRTNLALPKILHAMELTATRRLPKETAELVDRAEREGYLDTQLADLMSGYHMNPIFRPIAGKGRKLLNLADVFRHMERFNRRSMAAALHMYAGVTDLNELKKGVEAPHFNYSKGNRPKLFRGKKGIFLVFRSFWWQYLHWIKRTAQNKEWGALGKSAIALVALGGLGALPFADVLKKLFQKAFGINYETHARRLMGKTVGRIITHGIPAAIGIHFTRSVGFGDIMPMKPSEWIGVPYDIFYNKPRKVAKDLKNKDYMRALEDIAPEFINNPLQAYRMFTKYSLTRTGRVLYDFKTGKPQKFTKGEALLRCFGWYPERMAEAYEIAESLEYAETERQKRKQDWANRLMLAYHNRDGKEMRKVFKELGRYNYKMKKAGRVEDQITDKEMNSMLMTRFRPANIPPKYMMRKLRKIRQYY